MHWWEAGTWGTPHDLALHFPALIPHRAGLAAAATLVLAAGRTPHSPPERVCSRTPSLQQGSPCQRLSFRANEFHGMWPSAPGFFYLACFQVMRVVACIRTTPFYGCSNNMPIVFFIPSPAHSHLGYSYILLFVNNAIMNILMQVFLWIHVFNPLGISNGIFGSS